MYFFKNQAIFNNYTNVLALYSHLIFWLNLITNVLDTFSLPYSTSFNILEVGGPFSF